MENLKILVGDCLETMKSLQDGSVDTCITSPPNYGMRDNGISGQLGHEKTSKEYVDRLVGILREAKRVMRDDATLWLNVADCYSGSGRGAWAVPEQRKNHLKETYRPAIVPFREETDLKHKEMMGIPWRVAFAMQDDGWFLRQEIIWHKTNPMPSGVVDRCTKAHEQIFIFTKNEKYYFDLEAIKENSVDGINKRNPHSVWTFPTDAIPEALVAPYPPELIERCVLAGCPIGGTVLDPFAGSGTTAGVALKHDRKAVLCELNPEFVKLMPRRIADIASDKYETYNGPNQGIKKRSTLEGFL